jgi:hypothetical protein
VGDRSIKESVDRLRDCQLFKENLSLCYLLKIVFRVVNSCGLVVLIRTNVSEEHVAFIFRAEKKVYSSKMLVPSYKFKHVTNLMIISNIFTAVRTSDLTELV